MSRFAAEVENIGALGEQGERAFDGSLCGKKVPAVGKRIRGHVDDAHDESSLAELEHPAAQIPLERVTHERILSSSMLFAKIMCGA